MTQPIKKYKIGQWSASIWPRQGKDGGTYYGFNLQRSYVKMQNGQPVLDGQGQKVWERQSVSFGINDIQKIEMLLWKVFHWNCFSQKPTQPVQQPYGQQSQVIPPQQNTPFETEEDCPI